MTSKVYAFIAFVLFFFSCVLLTYLTIDAVLQQEVLLVSLAIVFGLCGFLYRKQFIGILLVLSAIGLLSIVIALKPVFIALLSSVIVGGVALFKYVSIATKHRFVTKNYYVNNEITQQHGKVIQQKWVQQDAVSKTFEWEDQNVIRWFGDTTIHLGNTVLPDDINVLALHKMYGDIRIIVPVGVGVVVYHNTLYGNVFFAHEQYELKNSQLIVYSDNYDVSAKKIKLVTTVYFGNLEVVYL